MIAGRTGLLLPAVLGWGVALLATALPAAAPVALAVGAAALPVAAVAAVRRPGRRTALTAVAAVVVALIAGAALLAGAGRHPAALETGRPVAVEVRVVAVATTSGRDVSGAPARRSVVHGVIEAVRGPGGRTAAAVPAVLFADPDRRVAPGVRLLLTAVLQPAAATDQAAVVGPVRGRPRVLAPAPPVDAAAQVLRTRFLAVTTALPGDGGDLLPGLAIGDTSRVGPSLEQAMQDASLTHLTAVSGANCAIVVLAVLAIAGQARVPRLPRTLLAGAALAGFVVLVGPQPSVVRASVTAAVGLACVVAGRRTSGPAALAVTVLVLLALDPWIAWSAGFVLSAAATAGLLLLAPPLADRLGRWLPRRWALLVAVPIAAQAACQPVLVLLQPGLPLAGVPANLLAEPAVPVATVLALAACLLAPVAPPLAAGLGLLAWVPAAWIALVARAAGALPQLPWAPGLVGAGLAAALVGCGLLALRRRSAPGVRAVTAALAVLAAVALAGAAVGGVVGRAAGVPHDWTLAACDVGQGDGLVLRGGGRTAVVDTGREPGPILGCLDRLGVRTIDLLVLTHWDADHVGAAEALADRVRTAFVGPVDGPAALRLRRALAAAGTRVVQVHRGDAAVLGPLRLDVLWPPEPLGGVEPGNAASVTLHVSGRPSVLLTGDLGEQAQDALLALGPLPRVDVVKVAHHGSADQSPRLYAAVGAAVGVVSVGADNDYGHPTGRLLRLLRAVGTAVVRTDQDGLVLIGERDGRLRVWTERPVTAAVWTPAK